MGTAVNGKDVSGSVPRHRPFRLPAPGHITGWKASGGWCGGETWPQLRLAAGPLSEMDRSGAPARHAGVGVDGASRETPTAGTRTT